MGCCQILTSNSDKNSLAVTGVPRRSLLEQEEFFIIGSTIRTPSCPCPTVLGADLLLCALVEVAESSNPAGFPRKVFWDVGRMGSVGGRGLQGHLAIVGKCSLKDCILTF